MTDKEILEAQKFIADMRNVLTVLTGTTDADKLVAAVLEKVTPLFVRLGQFGVQRRIAIFGPDISVWFQEVAVLLPLAEMAQHRPGFKAKLVDAVASNVPRADAILDKSAQALR